MKIAILLTGQPRNLEQGSYWFRNFVFPENSDLEVDYYCYFWDDGDPLLPARIRNTYAPVRFHIQSFDKTINNFIYHVQKTNKEIDNWSFVPQKYQDTHLFNVEKEYISDYSKNIWGQFFCSYKMTQMLGRLDNYDIVIRTRSDVAFRNMDLHYWVKAFENMHTNPNFDGKIFTPWLYVHGGMPLFADFAFISKPDAWYNYNSNIDEHCFNLATTHKQLWYELDVSNFFHHPHWIWNKLAMYSQTHMLSFSVTWPMPWDCKLIRYPDKFDDLNWEHIKNRFDQWEIENPFKN
jgi:hypothetical protein